MDPITQGTYPKCQTCQHWNPINRGGDGACSRIGVMFNTWKQDGYLLMGFAPETVHGHPPGLTRVTFGCLLHSELAEAGA